jgi:hypothetical protein
MTFLTIKDLTSAEINSLATCNHLSEIIAVQMNGEGKPRIITIARSEVSCWQLFLKFFHCGKFAKTEIHLNKVVDYLSRYDWKNAACAKPNSEMLRAYLKVCALANLALFFKGNDTLLPNVALHQIDVSITKHGRHFTSHTVKWNPLLHYGHIIHWVSNRYRHFTKVTIEKERSYSHPNPYTVIRKEDLPYIKINIGRSVK